jgi:glutathione S-transferase
MQESWECFEYTKDVKEWNPMVQLGTRAAGTVAMSLANGKIKAKYNIVDERKELEVVLLEWTSAVGDKQFLHGDQVSLPDIMVFGVLRSIQGLTTFNEIMEQNSSLRNWYQRVDKQTPTTEICNI